MGLILTIRTADRRPRQNYVGKTVRSLVKKGADPSLIHLFPTNPNVEWLDREVGDVPVVVHPPEKHCNPNENGVHQVSALDHADADWIVMCEDDIETCADPVGSMYRWLNDHARSDVHVYRFFALPRTPMRPTNRTAAWTPLREMRGSQAIALRADDARDFASWASAHATDWRPKTAPYQDQTTKGFDKLVGYWALERWPEQGSGLLSIPMMVNHIGVESAMYSHGLRNDREFAGHQWSYGREVRA